MSQDGSEREDPSADVVVPLRGRRASEDERIRRLQRARMEPRNPNVEIEKHFEARDQQDEELFGALLRRAERALTERRFRSALRDCERALRLSVTSPALHELLTRVHVQLGDLYSAAEAAERLVTLGPISGLAWARLSRLRAELGDVNAAREAAVRGTILDDTSGEPWAAIAELGHDLAGPLSDYDRAWYYEQALAREPNRALWLVERARRRIDSAEAAEVLAEAERGLALDPRDLIVRATYAYVLTYGQDDHRRSLAAYEGLMSERRRLPLARRIEMADAMAELHTRLGTPAKGYALVVEVAEAAGTAHRWMVASDAALAARRWKEALYMAAHASDAAPDDPNVIRLVGERYGELGAARAGEELLTCYLSVRPNDASAHLRRAYMRRHRRRWKAAGADFDRAVELATESSERLRHLAARADFRLERGDVKGALADHTARVRADRDGIARMERGQLYMQLYEKTGDRKLLAAAMRDFDGSIKRGFEDAYGFRALARELGTGHYAASCADLERAAVHGIGVLDWLTELSKLHARHGNDTAAAEAAERAKNMRWVIDLTDGVRNRMRRRRLDEEAPGPNP